MRTIFVDVALKGPGGLAMGNDLAERAAGFQYLRRQTVHLEVTLVANDKPLRGIEQQQALRHVVDRGVQALLFHAMLLRQLANDKEQHRRYHEHQESGYRDQKSGLFPPIGQRRRDSRARDDRNREAFQRLGRCDSLMAVDRAGRAYRAVARLR